MFSTDFFGPVKPASYTGAQWGMLFICDKCGHAMGEAAQSKHEAPEILERATKKIRKECEEMRKFRQMKKDDFRGRVDDVFLVVFPIMFLIFNLLYWPLCLQTEVSQVIISSIALVQFTLIFKDLADP